jgi:NADH-quinone oxidoreductase subunit D
MAEMLQSNRIIKQALEKIAQTEPGNIKVADPRVSLPPKEMVYSDIASLINHFKLIQEGITPPKGEVYQCIEAPKGEMGFYIVSDGGPQPLRVKVRTPSFVVLGSLDKLCRGRLLSDMIAMIGTMDIVLADVDRCVGWASCPHRKRIFGANETDASQQGSAGIGVGSAHSLGRSGSWAGHQELYRQNH